MRRVPGVSPPKRSCFRLSPLPISPWPWPDGHDDQAPPSHTPRAWSFYPTQPRALRRPVVPQATGLSFGRTQKRRRQCRRLVCSRSGQDQLALARNFSWQAPQALPVSVKAAVSWAMSPEPAATVSLSNAASAFLLAASKPAQSVHTAGRALVSPLSEPAGNSLTKAVSRGLSLAACSTAPLVAPFASIMVLIARIAAATCLRFSCRSLITSACAQAMVPPTAIAPPMSAPAIATMRVFLMQPSPSVFRPHRQNILPTARYLLQSFPGKRTKQSRRRHHDCVCSRGSTARGPDG